ncbi:methylmalonyl-CoA mutase family protein [Pueribacillus sp. YX66]|uniref:methylmalonyl-CoA mutase family protein n=1 Tax=Pueribacillus sp. YX66 TaxID=3229242 RepID=UPI00358D097A
MSEKTLQEVLNEINEFPVPTYEEWKNITEKSLKGASFEKLLTKTYEGITLQPMYQKEVLEPLLYIDSLPGFFPFQRGTTSVRNQDEPWIVNQKIAYQQPKKANEAIQHDLEHGQTSVHFVLHDTTMVNEQKGVVVQDIEDLNILFENINLEHFPVYVSTHAISLPFLASFAAHLKEKRVFLGDVKGTVAADPLGLLVENGSLPYSLTSIYDTLAITTEWAVHHIPQLSTLLVQGQPYHNGGGSAVEELAFSLATAVEYVENMLKRGLTINEVACRMTFSFSIGSNVFMEIAKFRAARMLWANIVKAFGGNDKAQRMFIHAETSKWNKTIYDPHVNILRGAIEAFAGAVGGVDSMHIAPFDELTQMPTDFSRRVARNTQIILQEEAHLGKVNDPAGGSWYVEALTDEIAKKSWELFQHVEEKGGMFAALRLGFPQAKIAEIAAKRDKNIKHRKDVFVGTNKYANPFEVVQIESEQQGEKIEQKQSKKRALSLDVTGKTIFDNAIEAASDGTTIVDILHALQLEQTSTTIESIPQKRGAEPFEQLRLAMERHLEKTGKREKVFLANVGPIADYKPRADFASSFFEVGGFEVVSNNGFATIEEVVVAARESRAGTIVICSKDDIYREAVPVLLEKLASEKTTVYVAGNLSNEELSRYKQAGLADTIHAKSNVYDVLVQLQRKKGVLNIDKA